VELQLWEFVAPLIQFKSLQLTIYEFTHDFIGLGRNSQNWSISCSADYGGLAAPA